VEPVKLGVVVAFLNTRDERRFGRHAEKIERDQVSTPSALEDWLVRRDLLASSARVTAADVQAAGELRDLLRRLIAGEAGAGRSLTLLSRRHPLVVSFDATPRLTTRSGGVAGFLAAVLGACATAATNGDWARVKMCAAPDCRFVFYDRGRNRLGRWCAMEACGSRMKARRFRTRARERRDQSRAGERGASG